MRNTGLFGALAYVMGLSAEGINQQARTRVTGTRGVPAVKRRRRFKPFAHASGCGPRETARRVRQMAAGTHGL